MFGASVRCVDQITERTEDLCVITKTIRVHRNCESGLVLHTAGPAHAVFSCRVIFELTHDAKRAQNKSRK